MQWAYGIPMLVSVYPSTFRKCLSSNMPWWILVILGYNNHQVVDNRGIQDFGVKGHLGVTRDHSNTLKTLLHLHNLINFDETWDHCLEVLSECSGIFDWRSSWGLLESLLKVKFKQPSTTNLIMSVCWSRSNIKKRSWWPLRLTCGWGVKGQENSYLFLWGVKCWIT